jgi:DNA-binding transcriptional ArsR family regulator
MSEKYLMFNLDEDKTSLLADVISNKTCKKILNYLAEREACETEIARDLKIPANTVNYNIKKLLEAGLVEKSKKFSWSVKGKKIINYKIANKKILISPKSSKVLGILSAFLATGIVAFLLKIFIPSKSLTDNSNQVLEMARDGAMEYRSSGVPEVASKTSELIVNTPEIWIWFFLGGIFALLVFMILNWRKI